MNELKALLIYADSRFRTTTIFFAATTSLAMASLWLMTWANGKPLVSPGEGNVGGYIAVAILYSLLPAALWGIFVVDFHDNQNVDHEPSGFSHYLMRMPIATWKLATVALAMKAIWISCVAAALIFCLRVGANATMNLLAPTLAIHCVGVWVSWFVWRSLSGKFSRIASLLMLIPMSIGATAFSVLVPKKFAGVAYIEAIVCVVLATIYLLSCWLAYRSLVIARTNATGRSRPITGPGTASRLKTAASRVSIKEAARREFTSPEKALAWHDRRGSAKARLWGSLIILVPGVLIVPWIGGPLLSSTVLLFSVAVWSSFLLASGLIEGVSKGPLPTMAAYLVASPISSARIAWSRSGSTARMSTVAVLFSCIAFAILFAQPSRQTEWQSWATGVAALPSVTTTATPAGLGYSAAIALVAITFLYCLPQRLLWISLSGRQWIGILYASIFTAVMIVVGGTLFRWFMAQTDHDEMWESAQATLAWLPSMLAVACFAKISLAIPVAIKLLQSRLVKPSSVAWITIVWTIVVVTLAASMYFAVPDTRFGPLTALSIFVLLVPLGTVFAMPIAVDANRHRR